MEKIIMIQRALEYIEKNLTEIVDPSEIAKQLNTSYYDLQTSFTVIVGYSLSEYIRNRRLYEASRELFQSDNKVIDIAMKYGYESPDSFSKAFYKFHGILPSKIGSTKYVGKVFRPITVELLINGGFKTNYRIVQHHSFKIIGIPQFLKEKSIAMIWNSFLGKYKGVINDEQVPRNSIELAITENNIGEYGVYYYDSDLYMIAGRFGGGNVTDTLNVFEFEHSLWAVLELHGSNDREKIDRIEKMMIEDISENTDYKIKEAVILENYGTTVRTSANDSDYCRIQIPVKQVSKNAINALIKIANIISVLIIVFALAIGSYNYFTKREKKVDTNIIYNIAQFIVNNEGIERR